MDISFRGDVTAMVSGSAKRSWLTAGICGGLLVMFAILAWTAIAGRNPTYDETVHVPESWVVLHRHDFRIEPEHPPLWMYWAALPQPRDLFIPDARGNQWEKLLGDVDQSVQFEWGYRTLFREAPSRGVDVDAVVNRSRAMMLMLAVVLGACIACWSWKTTGAIGALAATTLFAFDPNFLAHGPLVKDDVAISLVTFGLVWATWSVGRAVRFGNLVLLCLLCGVALVTKFSGIVSVTLVAGLLIARALLPGGWLVFGRALQRRAARLGVAAGCVLAMIVISYAVVWASYGFRYSPTADGRGEFPLDPLLHRMAVLDSAKGVPQGSHPAVRPGWSPPISVAMIAWGERRHVLPQAWLHGLLFLYSGTQLQPSFLCGEVKLHGSPWYYPVAFFCKTPMATLVAVFAGLAAVWIFRRRGSESEFKHFNAWSLLCLLAPPIAFFVVAVASMRNLGLRYLLPMYPFLFLLAGRAAAVAWQKSRSGRLIVIGLCVGLIAESLATYPDEIPFFNVAAGGASNGIHLLGDSNLDWGQDLKGLAAWQRAHRDKPLYLCYFGTASPPYYGLRFTSLPGTDVPAEESPGIWQFPPEKAGVIAISATRLEGCFLDSRLQQLYAPLRTAQPFATIGHSIYLFDYSPDQNGGVLPSR